MVATFSFDLLILHLADKPTSETLLDRVIDPLLDRELTDMNGKLDEMLGPYQSGHFITYIHYFIETIQKVKKAVMK